MTEKNKLDPTDNMSAVDLLMAGMGSGFYHTALGAKQAAGLLSMADIQAQRDLDSALMNRSFGSLGHSVGRTMSLAPLAFLPGANTLIGGGLLGAAAGSVAPSASRDETASNIIGGGLLGAGSIASGQKFRGLLDGSALFPRRLSAP